MSSRCNPKSHAVIVMSFSRLEPFLGRNLGTRGRTMLSRPTLFGVIGHRTGAVIIGNLGAQNMLVNSNDPIARLRA